MPFISVHRLRELRGELFQRLDLEICILARAALAEAPELEETPDV